MFIKVTTHPSGTNMTINTRHIVMVKPTINPANKGGTMLILGDGYAGQEIADKYETIAAALVQNG